MLRIQNKIATLNLNKDLFLKKQNNRAAIVLRNIT